MMGRMCKLIAIEGVDATGKATQSKRLEQFLRDRGNTAIRIETPIKDGHTHRLIYWMLRNGTAKAFPVLFQGLQTLNRVIFQRRALVRLMQEHEYVIFDRWSLSMLVYGRATGVKEGLLQRMCRLAIEPDITILLAGPARRKEARDSYESDQGLQDRVRFLYNSACKSAPNKIVSIDTARDKEAVNATIVSVLKERGLIQRMETN